MNTNVTLTKCKQRLCLLSHITFIHQTRPGHVQQFQISFSEWHPLVMVISFLLRLMLFALSDHNNFLFSGICLSIAFHRLHCYNSHI